MTNTTTVRMPAPEAGAAQATASFEYAIYVASRAEKLWDALTINELRRHWWRGHTVETDWKPGSPITGRFPDGSLEFRGRVLEAERPQRLAWEVNEMTGEFDGEAPGRLEFTLEPFNGLTRLTLRHRASPRMLALVGQGWPAVLSSLKSLLETGIPLPLDLVFGPERNPGTRHEGPDGYSAPEATGNMSSRT